MVAVFEVKKEIPVKISRRIAPILSITCVLLCGSVVAQAQNKKFNKNGDILIADQFNNRVIEINPETHEVVWQFGTGSSIAGPDTVVGTNDAQKVGPMTLIAGTGIPPGGTPDCPNGCPDNRVMLVNPGRHIVWQYGKAGVTGSGPDELNTPVQTPGFPTAMS